MTIKKDMNTSAPDTAIKVSFNPDDTADEVYEKFDAAVQKVKDTPLDSGTDQLTDLPEMRKQKISRGFSKREELMDDINLKVKLYIQNGKEKFMGIGVLWVLQKTKELGSLRAASADLGISYSKVYRMIVNLEKNLGAKVVDRKKGGSDRSGATLTEFGERFADMYDSFQRQCKALLDKPFEEFTVQMHDLIGEYRETQQISEKV